MIDSFGAAVEHENEPPVNSTAGSYVHTFIR
jgi:hypothetical protein